jgi:hypothetical protein
METLARYFVDEQRYAAQAQFARCAAKSAKVTILNTLTDSALRDVTEHGFACERVIVLMVVNSVLNTVGYFEGRL